MSYHESEKCCRTDKSFAASFWSKLVGNTAYLRFGSVDAYDVQTRHYIKSSVVA